MAEFIAMEAKLLSPGRVILGHHDDWMPPVTRGDFDMEPVRVELAKEVPGASLLEAGYLEPVEILGLPG